MPVIKTLKNGVWTKVSSFGELATATSSLNGLMSSADKSKLDKMSNYSTDEQVIGTWIDGKPLYRKVIQGNTTTINEWTNIGNIGASISSVIRSSAFLDVAGGWFCPAPYVEGNSSISIIVRKNGIVSSYITNNTFANRPILVIVEYTKTTD